MLFNLHRCSSQLILVIGIRYMYECVALLFCLLIKHSTTCINVLYSDQLYKVGLNLLLLSIDRFHQPSTNGADNEVKANNVHVAQSNNE